MVYRINIRILTNPVFQNYERDRLENEKGLTPNKGARNRVIAAKTGVIVTETGVNVAETPVSVAITPQMEMEI